MPRIIYIREMPLAGQYAPKFYEVLIPLVTDPGFYRTITSLTAFFHSGLSKPSRCWTNKRIFSYEHISETTHWFWHGFDGTLIRHPSLFDFYIDIGYDRKTKKYIDVSERQKNFTKYIRKNNHADNK